MERLLQIGTNVTTAHNSGSVNLCWGCKQFREAVVIDDATRSFCSDCANLLPSSRDLALLDFLAATVPYAVGDKVSCKTGAQIYDGVGTVTKVSFDPADLASPVMPMFLVSIDEKAYDEVPDEVWYSEVCLERVTVDA
jgi:hypothetical protein